jgi:arsenate reductase-like glutaredoxin family protein
MKTKICTKCGVEKSLDGFGRQSGRKDGLQSNCKACNKAYREANRESRIKYLREYHAANRDAHLKQMREYAAANREAIRKRSRAYRAANREAIRESKQKAYWAGMDHLKDVSITNRPHVGYRWYWPDGSVAYVGITYRSVAERVKEHVYESPWYREDLIAPTVHEVEFANLAEGQAWERDQVEAAVERGDYILNTVFNPAV